MGRAASVTLAVFVCFALWGCGSEAPPRELTESTKQPMSGGQVDSVDLAVGLLFSHADGGTHVNESCSGSLIAPTVILTAGHCFDTNIMDAFYVGQGVAVQSGDTDWEKATVHMRRIRIDQWARPPAYMMNSGTPPTVLDVAVGRLAEAVTDVDPLPLGTAPPPAGAMATTIGFGRHPTSAGPDQACIQGCNGDCTCQKTTCGCKMLQPIFQNICLCNDMGAYDQLVKRTATVTIAEALATTLHQSAVTDSVDLPGDSGGPLLYNGAIVGTDCCGHGPANAQTDQYFARIDLAHDWIVGKVRDFGGDAGGPLGTAGAGGSAGAAGRDAGPGAAGAGGAPGAGGNSGGGGGNSSTTGSGSGGATSGTTTGSSSSASTSSSTGAGGGSNRGGAAGATMNRGTPSSDSSGCSCRTSGRGASSSGPTLLALLGLTLLRRARRRTFIARRRR